MLAVDEMVASLVDELEAAGELENTYIVFTSDNGYHLGEHRIPSEKDRPYEESVRVPLFVRGPGIPAESQAHMLTLNTDFAPTFAELAGVEGFSADGRSLVPLLGGEEPSSAWRSSVLLEKLPPQQDSSQGKAKGEGKAKAKGTSGAGGAPKGGFSGQLAFEAVRTETHKYVEYDNGDVELYDVEADPYELESIHESADPALLEDLKAKLEALKSCSEEGCREAEDTS
jgi:N-acetylglucosamine-6-sulfatase